MDKLVKAIDYKVIVALGAATSMIILASKLDKEEARVVLAPLLKATLERSLNANWVLA